MIYTEAHWNTLTRSPRFQFLFEIAMLVSIAQTKHLGEKEIGKK
jgi:hypothetical protein